VYIILYCIILFIAGSDAHPASYPIGKRVSFPRGKAVMVWS